MKCEQNILRSLDWRLNIPNNLTFLHAILELLELKEEQLFELLARGTKELSSLVVSNVQCAAFYPSVITSYVLQSILFKMVIIKLLF